MNYPGDPAIATRLAHERDLHKNWHYVELSWIQRILLALLWVCFTVQHLDRPAIMKSFASLALFAAGATAQIIESTSFGYDKT